MQSARPTAHVLALILTLSLAITSPTAAQGSSSEGQLVYLGSVHISPPRPGLDLPPEVRWVEDQWDVAAPEWAAPGRERGPSRGLVRLVALCTDFSDKVAQVAVASFQTMLFSAGTYPSGSMRDYFLEASYGQLNIVGDVYGWYRAPKTYAYYTNNDYGVGNNAARTKELVTAIVQAADPAVNYSLYDNDQDGYVDALYVIHAGQGAEYTGSPNDIWSHASSITPVACDGVRVMRYSIQPEYWAAPGDMTIGVYAHETGHTLLSLPDLYDTDNSSHGLGRWSLMASGSWNGPDGLGGKPAHPDPWCKVHVGWTTPYEVTGYVDDWRIRPFEEFPDVVKVWASTANASEYFLIANHRRTGFDSYLPGQGLTIWHVDGMKSNNRQEWYPGLSEANHYKVALEQADGLWHLERRQNSGDANDPFAAGRVFDNTSTPNSRGYNQATALGSVTQIQASGNDFLVDFNGTQPGGADLVVSSLSVSPNPSMLGTMLTLSVQGRNQGTTAAGAFYMDVWAHLAAEPIPGPYLTGDRYWRVNGLSAGAYTAMETWTFTPSAVGTYTAWAIIDSNEEVPEVNDYNNTRSAPYQVGIPDLVISTLTVTPDPSNLGTALTASVTGQNTGAAAAGPFRMALWEHRTSAPSDGTGANATWDETGLAADASTSARTYGFTPASPGSYTSWAMVDTANSVAESNEGNNTASDPYEVRVPDLVLAAISVTPDPSALGTDVTASIAVRNEGAIAAGPFTVALWRNRTPAPTDGTGASTTWSVNGLAASGQWSTTSTYKPTTLGQKRAWAMADCWHTVVETNETNNTANVRYAVEGPDLIVSQVAVSPDLSVLGTQVTANITVRNQGPQPAGAFTVAFWQHRETQPADGSGADQTWPVPSLAASADWAVATSFTPGAVGTYTAWAMADCWRKVTEGNEANNTASDPYTVETAPAPPDLVLSELTVSPDPSVLGTFVTATIKVTNQGGRILTPFTVALWRNRTPSPVDGTGASTTWVVPSLAGGAEWTTTSTFKSTSVGWKRAWAMADCWGVIAESDETNNVANRRWLVTDASGSPTAQRLERRRFGDAGLVLFSLPVDSGGLRAAEIFRPKVPVLRYDLKTGESQVVTGPLEFGVGYWMMVPEGGVEAAVSGLAVEGDSYEVQLEPGWQAIGNPFPDSIDWKRTEVIVDGVRQSLALAARAGLVAPSAWLHAPATGYALAHGDVPLSRLEIGPWEAFCLKASRTLVLVLYRALSSPGTEAAVASVKDAGAEFVLSLEARCDGRVDAFNLFGAYEGSAREIPAVPEPPAVGRAVSLWFEPEDGGPRRAVDIRPASPSGWEWSFVVSTAAPNAVVEVSCSDLRALPREYEAVLTDAQTGKSVSLRSSPRYEFETGAEGTTRSFTLAVRRYGSGLRITGLTADSAVRGGGVSIAYGLSQAALVTAEVMNLAGRVVGVVASDELQPAGPRTLYWNARSVLGTALPAGEYLIRVSAVSETGERTTATVRAVLGM